MRAKNLPAVRMITIAVQAALAAMAAAPLGAFADDIGDAQALMNPKSYVELGLRDVSDSSAKFGEYNGLNKSGIFGIGNFELRGGAGYGQNLGTLRWGAFGSDLGATSRELGADVNDQGHWNLGLKYDELRHNITDTYQTPFQGSIGGNVFTLPGSFGIVNSTGKAGSNSQLVGTRNLSDAQLASFQRTDVSTTRQNALFSAGYDFSEHWNLRFSYNHLEQDGAKLTMAASSSATTGAGAAGSWTGEAPAMLMNPTKYDTDTFNLATNWTDRKGYFSAAYYGSFFRDAYDRLAWESGIGKGSSSTGQLTTTLAGGYQQNMLSTAPSNNFNQLNLTGGYSLRPATKLAGGLSYGRNTQNANYLADMSVMQAGGLPQTSLNGLVVTTHADLKATDTSIKDLTLTAGFKYNERENRSTSNVYKMLDLGAASRLEINTPFSNRRTEVELAGDYRLTKAQNVRVFLDREDVKRWCENVAGAYTAPTTAVANSANSPAGANCVVVPSSTEDKIGASYRLRVNDGLNFTAGYTHAKRSADVDHNALTPLNDQGGTNVTGIVNASDYVGYLSYFSASRTQDLGKAAVNWQAADRLNITLSGRYSGEKYPDSTLGVQSGHSGSANVDATYTYSERGSVSVYATQQTRSRDMWSGASGNGATDNATNYAKLVAPTNLWFNKLTDSDQTVGITARHRGLFSGKLELIADVSVTAGKTKFHTDVPYLATCGSANVLSCGDTPEIYSRTEVLKLRGNYQIDKRSSVSVGYWLQKLVANDYYYNAYQYGYTPSTMLPTNQQSPSYTVHVMTVSYRYTF
jgi:MtrB/PioB family decaheme-associated outer membrane protein